MAGARRGILVIATLPVVAHAAQNIRVVTYNTQDDVGLNQTLTDANLATVLEGIGQQKYTGDGIQELPDIIALQETTSNATTVANITRNLDTYYNSSAYTYSTYQATYYGNGVLTGNGPNALIYNQSTLNLMASVGVGTPKGIVNGEYRQVMRYEFQPLSDKGTSTGVFYVYDTHSKSGSASTSTTSQIRLRQTARCGTWKRKIIRNDETTLPRCGCDLCGRFQYRRHTEAAYQTMTTRPHPMESRRERASM